jgi:two-component system, NtrC family, response regulator AtoC
VKSTKVLVIDDERLVRNSMGRALRDEGYEVTAAATVAEGFARFEDFRPQVVILDIKLPDGSGLDLLPRLRKIDPSVQVVVITAFGEEKTAAQAMKLGAADFLKKPYDLGELRHAVDSAARSLARETQLKVYRRRQRAHYARSRLIGGSTAMGAVKQLIGKVARSGATKILITGETGTGKELVAGAIHFESGRRRGPLISLNCSNFQENLLESELFGHEAGAFTGASHLKRGLVELSDGGTLMLDEVAEMPLNIQAKLLRFLDHGVFRRVGGNVDFGVDLQVIAATNADLEHRIQEGQFRDDLYFRLKVVSIHLPPLRDRGEDVLELARHFMEAFSRKFGKDFRAISSGAAALLLRYEWPGNVRELENLLERAVLLEDGPELLARHLPDDLRTGTRGLALPELAGGTGADVVPAWATRFAQALAAQTHGALPTLMDLGDAYVRFVLQECGGNRSRAARELGMSRQGLRERLRRMEEREGVETGLRLCSPL